MTIIRNYNLANLLFISVVAGSLLRLHPTSVPSLLSVYGADFVLLFVAIFWFIISGRLRHWCQIKSVVLVGCATITLLIVSLFAGMNIANGFLNVFRFVYYGILFVFLYSVIVRSSINFRQTVIVLDVVFFLILAIAMIQLVDPPFFGSIVRSLYGDDKLRSIWGGYPRIYGTFYNANWFGVYLLFVLSFWLIVFGETKKKVRWLIFRLSPLIVLLFFSGSRTAIIGSTIVVVTFLSLQMHSLKKLLKIGFALVSIFFVIGLLAFYIIPYLQVDAFLNRFKIFFLSDSLEIPGSVSGRFHSWQLAINQILLQPVFGYGDTPPRTIPHNSYLTLILSFGFFGFSAIMFFMLAFSCFLYSIRNLSVECRILSRWNLVFSLSFLSMMMTADFIITSQVMFLWILISALVLSFAAKAKSRSNHACYVLNPKLCSVTN